MGVPQPIYQSTREFETTSQAIPQGCRPAGFELTTKRFQCYVITTRPWHPLNFRQINSYIVFSIKCTVFSFSKALGNSVCGHCSRISRIDIFSARLKHTLYLLYGVYDVFIVWCSCSQRVWFWIVFACVGLWKEPVRWIRSEDAFGNSSSDAPIDSLEKLHGDRA